MTPRGRLWNIFTTCIDAPIDQCLGGGMNVEGLTDDMTAPLFQYAPDQQCERLCPVAFPYRRFVRHL